MHNSSCHDELRRLILLFHITSSRLPRRERWRTSSSRVGPTTVSHIRPKLSCRSCSTSDKSRPNASQSWDWPSNLRSSCTAVQASDEQVSYVFFDPWPCLSCLPWWSLTLSILSPLMILDSVYPVSLDDPWLCLSCLSWWSLTLSILSPLMILDSVYPVSLDNPWLCLSCLPWWSLTLSILSPLMILDSF